VNLTGKNTAGNVVVPDVKKLIFSNAILTIILVEDFS
jgi:hypothetical protein